MGERKVFVLTMHRRHFLQVSGAAGSLWLAGHKSRLNAAPGPRDSGAKSEREPVLFLKAPSADAELDLALQRLGLPVQREAPVKDFAVAEIVAVNGSRAENALRREDAPASEEAYRVAPSTAGGIRIVSRTPHGLANGLYDLRRSLLASGSADPLTGLLSEGEHAPHSLIECSIISSLPGDSSA